MYHKILKCGACGNLYIPSSKFSTIRKPIKIYTDGSCHSQLLLGAWACLVIIEDEKVILKGEEEATTHNRMELQAVIKALLYIDKRGFEQQELEIYSDSQYVVNLLGREEKLKSKNFITAKGTPIQNVDLVQALLALIKSHHINFFKVKAHQKDGDVNNREVDIIVRQLVRKNQSKHDNRTKIE